MERLLRPHTHTGVTSEPIFMTFQAGTSIIVWNVNVPAGTACQKLEGGYEPWVVSDLSFLEDRNSFLYYDANIHGMQIPEDKICQIEEVQSLKPAQSYSPGQ